MNLNFSNVILYPVRSKLKEQFVVQHRVGNVYRIRDDVVFYAILSQVGENIVALICLENESNRYTAPVKVGSIQDISIKEFAELTGNLDNPLPPLIEITYIGRSEDVLKITSTGPLSYNELLLNKIFGGDEDKKDVISGS